MKALHIDFIAAGLIGRICDPTSVRRELQLPLIERAIQERSRLMFSLCWQQPAIPVCLRIEAFVGDEFSIRRPIGRVRLTNGCCEVLNSAFCVDPLPANDPAFRW